MPSFANEPLIVIAASCFILLLCLFIILFVRSYQKNTFNFLQEKKVMESAFKEQFLQSQMEVQEATLSTLSKELHDNIGQLLSSTKMLIGITERALPSIPDTLKTAGETLSKAINELRALSKSMSKEWLEQFDLLDNLRAEVNRINSGNDIRLHSTTPDKILMKSDEQVILFRIIQESVQNSLKHSNAANVFINLCYTNKVLLISIQDDGRGFDMEQVTKGLGLLSITQRTQILGGTIELKNAALVALFKSKFLLTTFKYAYNHWCG